MLAQLKDRQLGCGSELNLVPFWFFKEQTCQGKDGVGDLGRAYLGDHILKGRRMWKKPDTNCRERDRWLFAVLPLWWAWSTAPGVVMAFPPFSCASLMGATWSAIRPIPMGP